MGIRSNLIPNRWASSAASVLRVVGGKAGRHADSPNPVGSEGVDRNHRGESRIDTAGQTDHYLLETVLGGVVAEAQLDRSIDLFLGTHEFGDFSSGDLAGRTR